MPPFYFPKSSVADIQVFTCNDATAKPYTTYTVPRGKNMLYIYALSSGGGGGGGFSGAAGTTRGGGGGGGSGGLATLLVPNLALPDTLFIHVPAGGAGGTAGVAGSAGGNSYVSVRPVSAVVVQNYILRSSNGGGGGGSAGTGSLGGTAGTAAATSSASGANLSGTGLSFFYAGQAGGGGNISSEADISFPITGINVMGGGGGSGTTSGFDFAGGGITEVASSKLSEGRPIAAASGSFDGSGGFSLPNYTFHYPGLGGAASNASVGGNGGNGGYGSGGGGGGAGTTGGRGGDGGSGLVIMTAW